MFIYPYPCIFLLVLRLLLFLQEDKSRSSRGVQDDLEQPIVAEFSDGVPPEGLGRLVQKELAGLSCVSRFRLASHGASCGVPPSAPWVHRNVFSVGRILTSTHFLATPLGSMC